VPKKLVAIAIAAAAAYAAVRSVQASRREEDLWHEATTAPDLR
jgi:hypothetical protein